MGHSKQNFKLHRYKHWIGTLNQRPKTMCTLCKNILLNEIDLSIMFDK